MEKSIFSRLIIVIAFTQLAMLLWLGWRFKFASITLANTQRELQITREGRQRLQVALDAISSYPPTAEQCAIYTDSAATPSVQTP